MRKRKLRELNASQKRLLVLIRYMRRLPASANHHFDMSTWFEHDEGAKHGRRKHPELTFEQQIGKKELTYCGTTACALGWAATIPAFQRAGLELRHWLSSGMISFHGWSGFRAAQHFFDIESWLAGDLFGADDSIKTPKQWARHAARVLNEWRRTA